MKKIISLILVSAMIVSLAACAPNNDEEAPEEPSKQTLEDTSNDEADKDEDDQGKVEEEEEEEKEDIIDSKEEQEKDVELYFSNLEYIETGDESLERVKPETRTVNYNENTTLEEAVVLELLNGPSNEGLDNGIPASVKLISVELEGNIAYVNFEKDGMDGSSLQETLTLEQILTSLLGLEDVAEVQFLLDGQIPESLMGHIDTSKPFDTIPK